ncbi:MAG: zinc ribbon domain-containing protein [Candidatus Marithrix sp.]
MQIITSKKIRIYPANEVLWFDSLNLYRRAYNLTIEFMGKKRKPSSEFRTQICDWCRIECEDNDVSFNSNLIQALKWMAKKYGKTVVDVNESYTSKTMWDGSILKNLGGKASILFQGKRVNRDIHGARNILIRFLTKIIEVLSPQGAYPLNITKSTSCGFSVF